MRGDATKLGDARRRVQSLVRDLPAGSDDPSFDQPWELRAFAIAVVAYHGGHYEWSEFQLSLIASIQKWEQSGGQEPWRYYEHWLNALETVLARNGVLSDAALDERTKAVLTTPKNTNHHEAHRQPVAVDPARQSIDASYTFDPPPDAPSVVGTDAHGCWQESVQLGGDQRDSL